MGKKVEVQRRQVGGLGMHRGGCLRPAPPLHNFTEGQPMGYLLFFKSGQFHIVNNNDHKITVIDNVCQVFITSPPQW